VGLTPGADVLVDDTHTCYLGDRSQRHDLGLRDLPGPPVAGRRIQANG
jgi:hypothetical protein